MHPNQQIPKEQTQDTYSVCKSLEKREIWLQYLPVLINMEL